MVRHSVLPLFLPMCFILVHSIPLKLSTRLGDLPTEYPGTMYDFFFKNQSASTGAFDADNSDFDLFRLIFAFAGQQQLLKSAAEADNGFTLFAPTDEALTQSARDIREIFKLKDTDVPTVESTAWKVYQAWFATMDDPEKSLTNVLKFHIVDKQLTRTDLEGLSHPILNTTNGQVILLSGITLSNGDQRFADVNPQLIMMDCHFTMDNGILHPIDRMLFPDPNGQTTDPEHVPPIHEVTPSPTLPIPTEQSAQGGGTGAPSASPPNTADSSKTESQAACFPASSLLHLTDGSTIPMSKLSAGHAIRTSTTEHLSSPVYLFSHRQHQVIHDFIRIASAHGHEITLTPGHYLYANRRKTAASRVKLGDVLQTVDGESYVASITKVREKGLFAPHTLHGDIVVNGILASSYTKTVSPRIAHMLLWPLRMLVRAGFAVEPLGGLLYNGSPRLAAIVPGGYDVY